jgi:hypothetical protein
MNRKFFKNIHFVFLSLEPKQRAHSPLLAAGLASKLKTDYIPYGRRFPARSEAGSFNS